MCIFIKISSIKKSECLSQQGGIKALSTTPQATTAFSIITSCSVFTQSLKNTFLQWLCWLKKKENVHCTITLIEVLKTPEILYNNHYNQYENGFSPSKYLQYPSGAY